MYAFTYHRPGSVADATALATGTENAKFLAGGQTLLPTMKQRLASPENLIDLRTTDGLRGLTVENGVVTAGAMTRHGEIATDPRVIKAFPGLAKLASLIGDPAVRNRGTVGGSVANFDPSADYPAALLALEGTITTDKRRIAAADFFLGLFETALDEGELITSVSFPIPARSGWEKFRNPASRYAIAAVFVADIGGEPRVGVTGAGANGAFRAADLEAALKAGGFQPEALENVSVSPAGLNADMHADAAYRAHLVKVMAKRAVASMQ